MDTDAIADPVRTDRFSSRLELVVVILMGITAVLTAYVSWQASLYSGNQNTSFTKGSALIGESNSMYNEASQFLSTDMELWNRLSDLRLDLAFAQERGAAGADDVERLSYKIEQVTADNIGEDLQGAIDWADAQTDYASPFDKEGFVDSYYADASAMRAEGDALITAGQKEGTLGDRLGLATVIFAMVLFVLGIVGTLRSRPIRVTATAVAVAALAVGVVMTVQVPMLTL